MTKPLDMEDEYRVKGWTSLVVKWIEIHLPVKWAWVQSLVWGDSTCCAATKAQTPQLLELGCSRNHERHRRSSMCLEPVLCNRRSHCNEKFVHCYEEQPLLITTREGGHEAGKI